jgi:hypothetical protein
MMLLREAKGRMKDFNYLWLLSRQFEFDGNTLVAAIRATIARRKPKLQGSTSQSKKN